MLSNGILDIEDTEGEEISLTAEAPQLTEEEKLRIESEDEEDGEKRIDLFASEDGEADPLNKLLMAEDGISTLFMKKGGRVPLRYGGDTMGGPNDKSNDDQGETSSDSGFGGENTSSNNNNNNDNDAPDTGGHSRFDVGSGYYGEEVTDKGGSGETITNNPDVFYDDEITRKSPIERVKTNYNIRKDDFVKTQRKDALMFMAKAAFMGIGPIGMYNFAKKQNIKKNEYIDSVKNDIDKLKELGVPEFTPHTDTLIQTLEQDILDLTQPKDKEEDREDNDAPVTELIAASTETIEDRDETDIFDVWDRIKAGQAKRAMLKESGIIQDNTQEETMMLNSGGLANLFRVKTQ